ncbi:MAG: OmpH family outer membrane protein [Fluviicola sp.]|nr:OmpH family outer membrane protein [Fluviicola sp.]
MKKIVLVSILFCSIQCLNFSFSQSKTAHVNTQLLMDTLPSRKKAILEIQEVSKRGEAELIGMDEQFQKAYKEYTVNQKTQSAQLNQYEEGRLQKMQQDLGKREQELNALIQNMTNTMNEKTYKTIQEATKTIATKKGFQYVLEEATTIFAGGPNITSEVIVELLKIDK